MRRPPLTAFLRSSRQPLRHSLVITHTLLSKAVILQRMLTDARCGLARSRFGHGRRHGHWGRTHTRCSVFSATIPYDNRQRPSAASYQATSQPRIEMVQTVQQPRLFQGRKGACHRLREARSGCRLFDVHRVYPLTLLAEQSKPGMRKVAAQEFDSIHGLKHLYSTVRKEHLGPA